MLSYRGCYQGLSLSDQSYCHRLQHDMYFLISNSRLNEQVVDKIILQLNRVYPQILTNTEAEKFRNPKASLHTRLSDLIKHLQKNGERHCQEFYRALQINAEQLYNDLPSRKILTAPMCAAKWLQCCCSVLAVGWKMCRNGPAPVKHGCYLDTLLHSSFLSVLSLILECLKTTDSADIDTDKEKCPVFFLACFSAAAGFALFWYCCNSDAKVIGRSRRILGFSPIIIGRHVRNICMLYLEDISRN
ncbi:caspase recruitment domain-containing protein 19 isoform X3 [Coturnix japonica]|uniref:caspase recruitment domain-containing protein 19 isoform X3 n=1 Tax=Coturnix japonica TaxID=93934 RepID=UPI0013A5C126|nr:caspase recruitment domain-containing protein 19 isoform X3 [Coturnix japonica]